MSAAHPYLQLSSPCLLNDRYEHIWFDAAHDHFLLFQDSYFFVLGPGDETPTPKLFYHLLETPAKMINAKVSLDYQVLSIQVSLTSVLVIDIVKSKRWVVTKKHPNDSSILEPGMLWSDHGGGSQDLILVTTRGLDLYKISVPRNQCKLSRLLPQPIHKAW
jgi:hypothetical protein